MISSTEHRTMLSPLVLTTFLVVGISGVLLAFHVKTGGVKALHEWIGYAFMAAGMLHLAVNWRTFASYVRQRASLMAITAGLVISLFTLYAGASLSPQKSHPLIQVFDQDRNGELDADEIADATITLQKMDNNRDGSVSPSELMADSTRSKGKQKI
ncbi:DUF4405 domain-containing protein [Trichlorobacter lovleyi]|uniref:EF-hand domain-containing protein n=1 Tax=Trichlorobacter lovleyi (strain ATCC BAA-1151 / DSM 17278 / SZ) TaxID=398767 RepID=B3E2B6_TRIL1|nr:DUF4405 domain-containing protein [Trichlorobacter lovleyi]ACD94169.1 conserved hypothetical protein [Trichlorobacter lovleyi SZ]